MTKVMWKCRWISLSSQPIKITSTVWVQVYDTSDTAKACKVEVLKFGTPIKTGCLHMCVILAIYGFCQIFNEGLCYSFWYNFEFSWFFSRHRAAPHPHPPHAPLVAQSPRINHRYLPVTTDQTSCQEPCRDMYQHQVSAYSGPAPLLVMIIGDTVHEQNYFYVK